MSSDDVYADHHRRLPGSVDPPDNHSPVGPAPSCGVKGIQYHLGNGLKCSLTFNSPFISHCSLAKRMQTGCLN